MAEAASLAEAERVLAAQAPAVVVLDEQLPDGSGTALAARLPGLAPEAHVVLHSGERRDGAAARRARRRAQGRDRGAAGPPGRPRRRRLTATARARADLDVAGVKPVRVMTPQSLRPCRPRTIPLSRHTTVSWR